MQEEDAPWPPKSDREAARAKAQELRQAAGAAGLKFEAYLPPNLALWLLDRIERGEFLDPSEAAFVLLGEARELEPHSDLRNELLRRSLASSFDDAIVGRALSSEEFVARLKKKFAGPRPKPAHWDK